MIDTSINDKSSYLQSLVLTDEDKDNINLIDMLIDSEENNVQDSFDNYNEYFVQKISFRLIRSIQESIPLMRELIELYAGFTDELSKI